MLGLCSRTQFLTSSPAAIISWVMSVHFVAIANTSWHSIVSAIIPPRTSSHLSRLICPNLLSFYVVYLIDPSWVTSPKLNSCSSFPISNISVTGNSIIPAAQAKNIGVIPYTLSHTPYPVCLKIQLVLTSKYIHNPNIFQRSYCYPVMRRATTSEADTQL